ncbi:MAG: hypothetical protein ACREGB_04545 [Candidatus Saccharimonadales bacterium]
MPNQISSSAEFDAHQRHSALGLVVTLAGAALVAAVAEGAMLHEKHGQSDEARITDSLPTPSEQLVIAHFGLNTNDEANAEAFTEHFKDRAEIACVVHGRGGVSLDNIMGQMIEFRQDHPNKRVTLYGHSWAGLGNSLLISRPEFREKFGPVTNLVYENSFVHPAAITNIGSLLLRTSHLGPLSWGIGRMLPYTKSPTYLTANMHNIARRERVLPGSAEDFAEHIIVIQPETDPYVANHIALAGIQQFSGSQVVTHLVDRVNRPTRSHTGATDYPWAMGTVLDGTWQQASVANELILAA